MTATPRHLCDWMISIILISAGENHGSVILAVTADKDGARAKEVWSSLGKDSQLRAEWQTPVMHDGHLYGLDNQGSAGPITSLVCLRLKDHKTVWQKNRFGKSNLILADGKLFLTTMDGEVVIVEASPKEFHELSRATIMETTRQAPALADGHLFVRDDKEVLCIDVKAAVMSFSGFRDHACAEVSGNLFTPERNGHITSHPSPASSPGTPTGRRFLDDLGRRLAGAVAGAGFDADQHRSGARLAGLQLRGELETVAGHDAVVGVGGRDQRRRDTAFPAFRL